MLGYPLSSPKINNEIAEAVSYADKSHDSHPTF